MSDGPRVWAVVPAAGVGRRMGADCPKQYLALAGETILHHTLSRLLAHPCIAGVVVAVTAGDPYWPETHARLATGVMVADGGAERADSVRSALAALAAQAAREDWVLVHDAARPCLRAADVTRLIEQVESSGLDGGLLGMPVRDTIKRADEHGKVAATVSRVRLWHAFTPQMFRLGALLAALEAASRDGAEVTDEASAMERIGVTPLLVEGASDNIKVTHPGDLELAELYIDSQRVAGHAGRN